MLGSPYFPTVSAVYISFERSAAALATANKSKLAAARRRQPIFYGAVLPTV